MWSTRAFASNKVSCEQQSGCRGSVGMTLPRGQRHRRERKGEREGRRVIQMDSPLLPLSLSFSISSAFLRRSAPL